MLDYANAKIYKIVGGDGSVYYGSTTQCLKARMKHHRCCKTTTAYQKIISKMDWEMVLVENYPCDSRKDLELREGTYIRENPCVNRYIPGRTNDEYYEDNYEKILSYQKEYRKEGTAKIRYYWVSSFGDPRNSNCVQRCDYMLFQ